MPTNKVKVEISAVDKTKAAFSSIDKSIGGIKKAFAGIASIVSLGGFGLLTKNAIAFGDAIDEASGKTGFAIETLQELRYAATQNKSSFKELENGLQRFTKRLGLARIGNQEFAKTYQKLGIDINQTQDQVFRQVVDTLGAMDDETNRLALTTKLFGDESQKLAIVFKGGTRSLDSYADKARKLGLVIDKDLIKNAAEANDQFDTMRQIIRAQFVRAFIQLAPAISAVGRAFAEATPKVASFFESFLSVDKQGRAAVEDTIRKTQESFDIVKKKLERRLEIDADPSKARKISDLFLDSREELEAKLSKLESRFLQGIKRIKEINEREAKNITSALDTGGGAVDLSGWLDQGENEKVNAGLAKRNKLLEEAKSVFESTRTPAEKYAATIKRLQELQGKFIDQDTFSRAIENARKEFESTDPAFQKYKDDLQEVQEIYDNTRTELEKFSIEVARQKELFDKGLLDPETFQRSIDQLAAATEDTKKQTDEINDAFNDLGVTFSSAFEDAIVEGGKFSDILKGIEKDIIRILARNLITKPLGGAIASGSESLFSSIFGARALGGPVMAGAPYIVGEQGPEMFVPQSAGKIAQVSPTININVNNSAQPGNNASDTQLAAKIGQAVTRALRRNG